MARKITIVAAVAALGLVLFTDAAEQLWALALFVFAAFAMTGLAQEFWSGAAARKKLSGEPGPQALVGLVSRNRRRYGGYIVHVGVIVLLIGVAASSSFQTNRDVDLRPGESTVVDGRTITYVKPTVAVDAEKFTFGSVLRIEEGGKVVDTLRPSRRFFRPTGQETGTIGSFFAGEATSEVGLRTGLGHDLWIAEQPNIAGVQRGVRLADKGFQACVSGAPGTPPQCKALGALMRASVGDPSREAQALEQISKLQSLAANRIVCLLCDRDLVGNGVTVDFFGETTTVPSGPATLALRTGARLLPCAAYLAADGQHVGRVAPALPAERQGRLRADVQRVTEALVGEMESFIRVAPEQWLLMQPNWPSDRASEDGSERERRGTSRSERPIEDEARA